MSSPKQDSPRLGFRARLRRSSEESAHRESTPAAVPTHPEHELGRAPTATVEAVDHPASGENHQTSEWALNPAATATPAEPAEETGFEWLPQGHAIGVHAKPTAPHADGDTWLPAGDGKPEGLSAQHTLAVAAHCQELCGPERSALAAGEASASLSADTRSSNRSVGQLHADALRVTRAAAARHTSDEPAEHGWRPRFVGALAAERDVSCRSVPLLLAGQADGTLSEPETTALDDHLRHCLRCRAFELRMERAERAFVAVLGSGLDSGLVVRPVVPAEPPAPTSEWSAVAAVAPADLAAGVKPEASAAAAGAAVPVGEIGPDIVSPDAAPGMAEGDELAVHRRRRALVPLLAALTLLAAYGVGAAALLSGGSSHKPSAAATSRPPAAARTTPTTTPVHRRAHTKHVSRHAVHKRPRQKAPSKPAPTTAATAPSSSAAAAVSTSPAVQSTPVVQPSPQPVPVAPAPPSQPSSSSGTSATIQQPSLGATNSPQQGISPKH